MTIRPLGALKCDANGRRKVYNPTKNVMIASAICVGSVAVSRIAKPDEVKLTVKEYGGNKNFALAIGAMTLGLSTIFSVMDLLSNSKSKRPCKNK